MRLATLASVGSGRIDEPLVREEIERLRVQWQVNQWQVNQWQVNQGQGDTPDSDDLLTGLLGEKVTQIDHFDKVQLAEVIAVCRRSRSLSDAGRTLFAVSRLARKNANDADRLQKYLARFALTWESLQA